MTEILIKEDIDKTKIAVLVELFNSWNLKIVLTEKVEKKSPIKLSFFDNAGLWKDRDIDAAQLRKDTWKILD